MEEHQYEYRTGRTSPRQKHNGIVAFLLILVIFLAGLVSVLGFLNIQLFRLLKQSDTSLTFSDADGQTPATGGESVMLGGLQVQEVSDLYGQVYDLPAGLYIAHVADGSAEDALGILPGDVLTAFAGTDVSSLDTLQTLLEGFAPGETVIITTCRNGAHSQFTITLEAN